MPRTPPPTAQALHLRRPIYDAQMHMRTFGRLGWQVSEIGFGMWGMAAFRTFLVVHNLHNETRALRRVP